uniref:Peroxisomal biogenesis factor 19 n=1 Tax=Pipistrellus kuhlii TaxID=59472 RepID=A0A7J7UTH7_PIPKU|nr:hypothetical protein mPipKuh1_008686 [Pipistrellus kuhlii]
MAAAEGDCGVGADADRELEELLESALDDFDKARPSPAPPPATTAPDASGPQKRSPGDTAKDALFASQEKFFQELFDSELASQATAEFEKAMKELAEEEPHLVEQFQKLSEAAGRVGSDATSQQEFTSCLQADLSEFWKGKGSGGFCLNSQYGWKRSLGILLSPGAETSALFQQLKWLPCFFL